MLFHQLLLLLLGVGLSPRSAASTSSSEAVTTTPPYHDSWCAEHCSSLAECDSVFEDNHVDLSVRVQFSIDDGPGRHLIRDKYFGTTISRQSFDAQFVLDAASALETSFRRSAA